MGAFLVIILGFWALTWYVVEYRRGEGVGQARYLGGVRKNFLSKQEPFVERDADGFITPESYRSHIQYTHHGFGRWSTQIDPNILAQTRTFKEQCDGLRQVFANQETRRGKKKRQNRRSA